MNKKLYFVQYPGIMGYTKMKLTAKEAENLRNAGYTVEL